MIKRKISFLLSSIASWLIKIKIKDKKICIISNDCWGAEFYKNSKRPYNTPFVGLMMMAPCYIKFLSNPKYYFSLPIQFTTKTKYLELQEVWINEGGYPIATLDDVEIHFLHYKSEDEAIDKWERRKKRIEWDNLYVKFSMDKDYSTVEHLNIFSRLPYRNKISFSRIKYPSKLNIVVSRYDKNGARLFGNCIRDVDLFAWFRNGKIHSPKTYNKLIYFYISRFLKVY